jgi:sn-glycerol 3-phosphate transport system ATP-binding protein
MASVEIQNVRKSYGPHWVIPEPLSLAVHSGEFMVLVGPSGCGKSTLLRMVAGLEGITEGTVAIGGKTVNDLSPQARGVAMVFQNYALYPHMTVKQNLAFALKMARHPKAEIEARVGEAAKILGIEEHLYKKPAQLSGGQKQRVAMGRAMVRRPAVFLFDEPLSNLDAQLRVKMRSEIAQLHRRLRSTILYVTHDQTEAMTLADRIAVLNAGRLEQVGTPLELYHQPRTRFVASFIGSPSMNFLPTGQLPGQACPGGTASVGFRPESLRLGGGAIGIGQGRVTLVEMLGATAYVHFALGESTGLIAEVRAADAPARDAVVPLGVDGAALYYFDRQGIRVGGAGA